MCNSKVGSRYLMKQPKIRRRCRSISSEKTDRKRHEANEVKTPRTEVPNEIRVVSGRESFVPIDTASVATPFHLICIVIISPDMDISRCSHLRVSCILLSAILADSYIQPASRLEKFSTCLAGISWYPVMYVWLEGLFVKSER